MALVTSDDWEQAALGHEAATWMLLLDSDIQSCQIALADYSQCNSRILDTDPSQRHYMFHYAKTFVCAMRRIGRLLESIQSMRQILPPGTRAVVRLVWLRTKPMFDSYIDARNAIEHIEHKIRAGNSWSMVKLIDDELEVTKGHFAKISVQNLNSAIAARKEIVSSLHT